MRPHHQKRGLRAAAVAALALALGLVVASEPGAQPAFPGFDDTDPGDEAFALLAGGKPIAARAKAKEALDLDPDSIAGNYVMGMVLYQAEGVLPRAMHHLVRTRRALERLFGAAPTHGEARLFHRLVIQSTQELAAEMEQFDEQLRLLRLHDDLYEPDMLGERAWALLHLNRFDEARRAALAAIESPEPWQRTLGYNARCAIEGEARLRGPHYEACLASLEHSRAQAAAAGGPSQTSDSLTVDACNASGAAASMLRFDEAEKLAQEGARAGQLSVANPWRLLVGLYTDEGRLTEAISAAGEMQRWRMRLPAALRDQDRAETDAMLAALLLSFGEADAGLRLITRAIDRPDRRGLVSSKHEQAVGAHALIRRAFTRLAAELDAERASAEGLVERLKSGLGAGAARLSTFPDDERIAAILADEARLNATLRVGMSGGISPPVWLLGDLVGVLGAGVVAVALEEARGQAELPELAAYYDAIEAEAALARGQLDQAGSLARKALETLPLAEARLKARAAAVAAEASRQRGDTAAARSLFQRALEIDAGVIRLLGLAIPASVSAAQGGGEAATLAAEMLRRSPRIHASPGGLRVSVEPSGAALRACLRTPEDTTLACAEVTPKRGEAATSIATRLAAAFHANAFAPRIALTTLDVRSLDGSTMLAGQAQREQLREILRDMAEGTSGQP